MFKPHFGTCSNSGCKNPEDAWIVVRRGFCQRCNHEFKQSKKKERGKKTSGYKYVKKPTGEYNTFGEVLEQLPNDEITKCYVCKTPIALVMVHNFAHVLPKGKYPLFRNETKNIVLLCHKIVADKNGQGCHYRWDMTPRSELIGDGWDKLKQLEEQLKEEYKSLQNCNETKE